MNDRYLFRAKRIDNLEWVEGMPLFYQDGSITIYGQNQAQTVGFHIQNNVYCDRNTLCQCTGLKDKNGKLIWENDIIHKPFYTDYDVYANSEAYNGRIQYEDGGWSVEITKSDGSVCVSPIIEMIAYSKDIENFEVIGNIFDNPELLESEG